MTKFCIVDMGTQQALPNHLDYRDVYHALNVCRQLNNGTHTYDVRPNDNDGNPIMDAEMDEFIDSHDVDDEPRDGFRDDVEADADTLASAGYGTDEDYGYFGGED